MENFKKNLQKTTISIELQGIIYQYWQRMLSCSDAQIQYQLYNLTPTQISQIINIWGGSDFAAELCIKNPTWLMQILSLTDEQLILRGTSHKRRLTQVLIEVNSEKQYMNLLRCYRNEEMLRIIWLNHNRIIPMEELVKDISLLADCCVALTLDFVYSSQCSLFGTPFSDATVSKIPSQQYLAVVALGKLGSNELNLSSDIDLMFCYNNHGETKGTARSISNKVFFTKVTQRLIHILNHINEQGFVFRVDIRLRPYGDSGPIVMCLAELEQYYQDHGRSWERYALLKARIIAGDFTTGNMLLTKLKPFVFKKYLDFSSVSCLRNIKDQLTHEIKLKQMEHNIKLGSGGIREIEFIVQSYQIIYGGKDNTLQKNNTIKTLNLLYKKKYLPAKITEGLYDNYVFLRNLEHAMQSIYDQQTQEYPQNKLLQQRITLAMGFVDIASLNIKLIECKKFVSKCFNKIITKPISTDETLQLKKLASIWTGKLSEKDSITLLIKKNFQNPQEIINKIKLLKLESIAKNVRRQSLERLDKFIPILFKSASASEKPDLFFLRILLLVIAVLKRTAYLVLLMENPKLLFFLGNAFSKSIWITEHIIEYPQLLDDLFTLINIEKIPTREQLLIDLNEQLATVNNDDLNEQMECLRHFKIFHLLRVNIAQIANKLPLMKISDYLTYLAEVIVTCSLNISWNTISLAYGNTQLEQPPVIENFIIIAYGKLGGIESSPASDLDLVFIYDNKNIENSIYTSDFFTKLSLRITHILSTKTISGSLYEVDTRLRPSGTEGLLVSSITGFKNYQANVAWLWEHQALVRTRIIAGDKKLAKKFAKIRKNILCTKRNKITVYKEVINMRNKIKNNYYNKNKNLYVKFPIASYFNLKHGHGGIIDIEFYIQMLVLIHAHKYNQLIKWTDNIRIVETLKQIQVIPEKQANLLIDAYKYYRELVHKKDIDNKDHFVEISKIKKFPKEICTLWSVIEKQIVR
jgi:glutamate-ammonia-ligase adenylyltransferase